MMILFGYEGFRSLWRAQAWAVEHLISVNSFSGDFRWPAVTLTLRVLATLELFAERQLASWARAVMGRALQGARLAADLTNADTMVAAGGG